MTPRPLVIASMLACASLTACSSANPGSEIVRNITVEPIKAKPVHPPVPAPVKLHDIDWDVCGAKVCTTPREAEKDLRNKLEVTRWIGEARDLIRFYRNKDLEQPEPSDEDKKKNKKKEK
jgi:hypothetical protein